MSRMRAMRATAPGSALHPGRPVRRQLGARVAGRELRQHRARELDQLDGLGAQLDAGVEAAEVEQLGGELARAAPSARAPGAAGRAPRAGRAARAASSSLAPCSISPSEVSGVRSSCEAVLTNVRRDCSCAASCRCIVANARARSPTSSRWPSSTGGVPSAPRSAISSAVAAQRGQPPHEPRRERDARDQRHRQGDERGGHERAPDDVLDPAEALERSPQLEHAACAAGLERRGDAAPPLRPRPAPSRETTRSSRSAVATSGKRSPPSMSVPASIRAGCRRTRTPRAPVWRRRSRTARSSCGEPARSCSRLKVREGRARRARRLVERGQRVLLELAVERDQHQQRGDGQRQHAHRDERRGEAAAQPAQLAHGACSR